MVRKENWPLELSAFLKEKYSEPFKWGENDCMLFVSKCVEKLTGVNFYNEYLGYDTEAGAKEVLKKNNGVIGIINKCLGDGSKNPLTAKRGDIAIVKMPEITAGIVDDTGQNIAVVNKNGIYRLPIKSAMRVWSY